MKKWPIASAFRCLERNGMKWHEMNEKIGLIGQIVTSFADYQRISPIFYHLSATYLHILCDYQRISRFFRHLSADNRALFEQIVQYHYRLYATPIDVVLYANRSDERVVY